MAVINVAGIFEQFYRFIEQKHREIAKGCPEYTSSVVEVLSCSNQKTFKVLFKIKYFQNWMFLVFTKSQLSLVTISVFEFCHYFSFLVLVQFEFLSYFPINFRTNPVVFRTHPVIFRAYPVIYKTNPVVIRTNQLILRADPVILNVNKVTYRKNQSYLGQIQPYLGQIQLYLGEMMSYIGQIQPYSWQIKSYLGPI